jgi:chromosome segregation ATPase
MIDDGAMIARARAECRFGGEGCELPPTDGKTRTGAKNGEANGKSVNFFKGMLLGVDTRQSRDDFINRPREARERRSPSPRPKREKPKPKAAPPPPPPPPPPPAKEDSASAISRLLDGLTNGSDVHDEPELSTSPLIKRVDNPMGVSFRVEPLALLEAWRGTDGGVKTVDDSWRVRALRAEEALRAVRNDCGDCHKRRATAEAALEEHTRWLGEERSAKAALEQELNDLKAHMEKKIQELTANAEKDRVKAKRSLEAAIEAANRVTKQNALDERRKRDQLDDLNAKLKKDIIELEKINANAQERISKLEIELKSSYDIKSSINISISTNEAFAKLEDDKHKLEIENAALKKSLDGKSEEVDRLKDELNALRVRINAVTGERDSATKELQTTSKKLTSEIKLLTKELEQSQSTTTVIERKLKESIESHVRETTIIRTKITQSEKSRKRDRTKFDTDRTNLRAEISRLMRLLSKAESREESVRGRKHLIEEELQVCRAKIRDLMTSDRHTLHYNSNQGVPDVERTLIERRTGLTFAHLTSRMQNFALKTRMLEYLDTIEKLRKDEVESQVQLKSKEELQSRDNERNAALIDELRKEIATLRDASEKLDADHSAAQQAHSAHVIKSNTIIAQLRQQISDGEAALQELKHSSTEAFKSAQASMESQKQAAADSLGLLESSLKSKDAEILELKTDHASYIRDLRSRDEKIDSLSDQITGIERELESRTAELSDRRAALGVAKWRASIRGTSLKNAYDALLVKLTNTETELKTVCELREKDQRRVQALENEIAKKYPVRATDGETAAVPSMSEADQLKMAQLEKQCKQLRAKNEEDVAKYRRLLREKDKEFTLVKQNEAAKLREAYNIINTQSVDLSRLDIKSKQLEVAVSESTKSTLMAEQHKVSVTKSIREVTQRCQILEEKHIKIQHVESMRPVETRAADVSAQQLQAQIAELRLQLDFKTSESDARDRQLRGSHAANVKEWQQKVEFLQNDLLNMTASRDSAKSELLALADELSVLKHQYNVNAEFSATRERDMAQANDTLRSSLDSAVKGTESINRRYLSLQDKAEATNAELTKRNDELRAIIAKLRGDHAECLDVRDKRIVTLEGMLQEYQSSLHETKTRYSRDLEGEVARLQSRLTSEQAAHASAIANGRSERARLRWAAMYSKSRIIQKHARFYAVSKDFSRSMKEEYRQHAAAATATIRSLDKTIKRLEKDLSDMMASKESLAESVVELEKRLAEGDSEHRSKLATLRWSHFARFLRFKARHNRFFQNSKQFAAALKNEVRESDKTIKRLEKDLSDMMASKESLAESVVELEKRLAEGDSEHRSKLATLRWSHFARFLRFKARHNRFFQNSKQFAAALKNEVRESDAFKFNNELALAARDNRIQALEKMVSEYQESLHETKTRYSRELEGEISTLRERIDVLQSELATSRWTALCSLLRTRKRHLRFLNTSKDFAKSMKTEYRLHAEGTTKTVRSLGDTIAALKKELADMVSKNKSLEGTIAKSKTDLKEMHKQSKQFETQIEQMQGEMFQTDGAMKARDERIGVLEGMVESYQNSLHETKTAYSRSLEQEIKDIRDAWKAEAEAHVASKRDRVRIRWSMLANELRLRNRGIRFTHTARDFVKSMRTEYRLHAEASTKTVRSLGDTVAALKNDLEGSKKSKSKVDEELKMLRKRRDDNLNVMKKQFEEAEKNRASIEKQSERTINSLNDEIRNLKKQLENEVAKNLGIKKASEARIEELQQLIASLEDGMKELQSSAESTKARLSSEESRLRSECATLRNRLDETSSLYAGLQETSSAKLAAARWRLLLTNVKQRDRHDRFFDTSKDFTRGMRADHKLYVEFTQRTITSLNESNAKLKQRADDAAKKEEAHQDEITTLKGKMASDESQARMKVEDLEEKLSESGKLAKQLNRDLDTLDKDSKKRYDEAVKVSRREADALRETIRDLEKKLDNANRSARKTDEKNKSEVEKLRAKFESLKKKDVDQRRITELEALVKRLEASIDEHEKLLTAARHTHKDEIEEKEARINELELERQRLETAISEYETSLESTRSSSSGQVSRLHGELRILREQLDESNTTRAKALVQAKSERAALHWSWMCRVLRARRLHQRHVALVKSFTSAELVEARSWAATSDKTIRSLNDQMLEVKAKLKALEDLDETVRVRDARVAELELLLQEAQSSMDSTKSTASSELQRLQDEKANLVAQLDDLQNQLKLDAEKAKSRAQSMKSDYDKQIEDLRTRARIDADESAAREHQAQVDFKNQLDDLAERLKNKSKSDATFEHARFLQMKEEYEKQLEDLRKRMKADADSAEARAQQSQADFEQQLADLAEVHKKDSAVVKFRQASAMGLRDKRIHELEALLLESQNDWEALKSTSTGDVITLRRELAESRSQIETLQAQWSADEEAKRVARIIELEKDVNGYKIALQAAKGENSRAADDITALQKSVSDLKELLKVSSEEKLTLASTIETLRAELEGLSLKTSAASNDGDALRSQLAAAEKALVDAEARALSQRTSLRWSWMCRVLRARRLHQRHVALVKSFTSAELVEARSWAATSDKTIRSLNDQMLEVKAKLKALEDLDETVRVRDARVAELELLLQEAQSSMDSTKSTASSELQRLQDEKANLVAQLDDLQNQLKLDAEKAKSRAQSMKSDYDKQIEDLRTRARIDADESAAREHQAQVDFKNQLDDLAERLKNKSKSDATFEHARFLQMKEEYEKQLEDLRKRMKADADSAEARAQQSQADFEQQLRAAADEAAERELEAQANFKTLLESLSARHKAKAASDAEDSESRYQLMVANFEQQLGELRERMRAEAADAAKRAEQAHADFEQQIADLVQIQKKELTVLKFRHASTLGLRDSRVEELERLLLEHETELEKSKSSMSGDAITTRRELSELRMQYEDFKAQSAVDAEDAARVAQRLEQELDVLRKRCVSLERTHDDAMMHTKSERAALRWRTTCRILQVKEGHRRFLNIALGHSKATLRELVAHRNTAQITIHSLQDKLDGMQKRLAGATESEASSEARERTLQEEIINLKLKISQLEKEKIRVSYEMTKSQAIIGQRDETISDLEKMLLTGGEQSVGLAAAQEKIKRLERDFNDLQSRAMADAASAAKRLADMEGKQYGLNKSERAQLRWAALLRCTIRDVRNKRLLSLASSFAGSLKTELKVHGEVATRTIHTLQADLDELRKQVPASANADEERKMLETKLAALQEKLAELKAKQSIIPSLQSELDALKAKSAEHVSEKELLEKELDLLRRQLSDAERVKGKNTGVNDELVKTLRQRISELEQEIISIERKHAAAVEKIISDHSFAIGKEIKDRENAARDYARIIEDLEGDLVEMTDSRDVAVSDMMKLRLRLDELERGAKDKSQASSSNDPDLLREIHVLRTKVEHLETELVTERTKREREVHALREKLSSREREATAAMTATNVASEETMRVKKELHLKITSQTTLIERLELQVKELKAEYESTQNELGAEAERVSSKSADLISAGKKLNDENVSLKEELDEALAELERLRVAKDFITKEFNFFQIEARQNADLIQRKLERTQEQLNDAEVELAKLRAQVQEYAAEQEELMFESQRIQKASDAKITKLRSELSNVRIEYEEDLRGKLAALKERISDLEDELSDEREKSVKAIAAAKLEAAGATGDSAATRAKIHDLEIELASTREEVTTLEDEIKSSQEAVEYAENWARMNDKRAQGAEEFLITLKVEIAELKRALVLAKSQPHDDGTAELQKLLDECHETCKSQLAELNELRSERDKLMARPEPKMADPNVGSTTVNFDLGDEPTFEMPEIPKRPEPEPVEPIRSAPSPTSKPTVVYDVEESMERRYGSRVEIATTYDTEVEDEPSEDGEQEEEPGYLEETEEILEIVEYDSDGNEIIVESRALAPGESVDESVLDDEPEKEPEQPVARRSGLWGRFGGAVDDIME